MNLKFILAVLAVGLIASGCAPPTKPATIYMQWPFDATEAARRQDETAKALGVSKELALDLGKGVKMKLVLIPAGKFVMGSPKNEKGRWAEEVQHEVIISKPFYVGNYTVTQEQYQQVIGKNPSVFKGASNPVEQVSWEEAIEFCKAVSNKTGNIVRLPTEAQWEYACRGGTATPFNTGDTMPASSCKSNAWGLFDMHGNIWQWCNDLFGEDYANSPKTDPEGPKYNGKCRVQRGGSWKCSPSACRSAALHGHTQNYGYDDAGFRVIVEIK